MRTVGIYASFKTVERVSERAGAEVRKDRHGPFAGIGAPGEAPPNPPALQVLQADGMRVRLTEDREDGTSETASDAPKDAESGGRSEYRAAVVASALKERLADRKRPRGVPGEAGGGSMTTAAAQT